MPSEMEQFNALLSPKERKALKLGSSNYGRSTTMVTVAVAGGFEIQPTTLIADVEPHPQQWMISVGPPTQTFNPLALPWYSTFDGTTTAPQNNQNAAGYNFGAPTLPTLGLQMQLRWGRGGVSFSTAFDYPNNGAVFGVTADTVYLDAILKPGQVPIVYPTLGDVPTIAAYMTEGRPANPTPLRWTDVQGAVGPGVLTPTYWSVKPFARQLTLYIPEASAGSTFELVWLNGSGTAVYQVFWTLPAGQTNYIQVLDVPANAVAFFVAQSGAAAATVIPVWELSFA